MCMGERLWAGLGLGEREEGAERGCEGMMGCHWLMSVLVLIITFFQ